MKRAENALSEQPVEADVPAPAEVATETVLEPQIPAEIRPEPEEPVEKALDDGIY